MNIGPLIARGLRRRRAQPGDVGHLDEFRVAIRGALFLLWRTVDQEDIVFEKILQRQRNKAKRLLRRLLSRAGQRRKRILTDKLASYGGKAEDRARSRPLVP